MGASTVLYRGIEKIMNSRDKSQPASAIDDKKDKIGDLFIKSGSVLPEDLMEDLYQFYIDSGRDTVYRERNPGNSDSDSLRDLAYHLVDVLDLFSMDYDEVKDPLKLDEWITVKDLFSSYAADIDDELLTYVMRLALEKGAFR